MTASNGCAGPRMLQHTAPSLDASTVATTVGVSLDANAIECPQCKRVMPRSEIVNYRAHEPTCLAYEIRQRRNEATISELAKRLVAAEQHADRLERVIKHGQDDLRISLLALARYLLTPGECLSPDECGGSDLCPCRTNDGFHGTCGINSDLKEILNEHVKEHPESWRYMAPRPNE